MNSQQRLCFLLFCSLLLLLFCREFVFQNEIGTKPKRLVSMLRSLTVGETEHILSYYPKSSLEITSVVFIGMESSENRFSSAFLIAAFVYTPVILAGNACFYQRRHLQPIKSRARKTFVAL